MLVYAEQGYGDTLQFVRYVPRLRALGARVILAVPAALHSLLANGCVQAIPLADDVVRLSDEMPSHDYHVPLTGLPHRLPCTTDALVFVDDASYLVAPSNRDGALVLHEPRSQHLRVGLVWAGSGTHVNDMHRSCGLKALLPLTDEPQIEWVSLQAGDPARELSIWPKRVPIIDAAPLLHDFADTAATISQLDVVITIDSAVAHLAGALGRPCVLLLPRIGLDWRWTAARNTPSGEQFNDALNDGSRRSATSQAVLAERNPWYHSVQCVRQSASGDWTSTIARVRELLRARRAA